MDKNISFNEEKTFSNYYISFDDTSADDDIRDIDLIIHDMKKNYQRLKNIEKAYLIAISRIKEISNDDIKIIDSIHALNIERNSIQNKINYYYNALNNINSRMLYDISNFDNKNI